MLSPPNNPAADPDVLASAMALGVHLQLQAPSPTPVWPCFAAALWVFADHITQLRAGLNGICGLDYTALPARITRGGSRAAHRRMQDLREMERAMLAHLDRLRERDG